jgi:GT2 family glycosyltransferase
MNVSIVMPVYKPDKVLLKKIYSAIKSQKFKGKVEIIRVEEGLGLADSLNYGTKKAKYPIIVSLHQDCIPVGKDWLDKLVSPLKDKKIVASVSKVEMPRALWDSFDSISKILSVKEQKIITPLLDEKGCAYKKSALIKVGLWDSTTFRTAGEDFDMYLKLKRIGQIAYPDIKLVHYHHFTWKKRLKKEFQLSNGFGALVKIYGKKMPVWYIGLLKSIPILGYPLFFKGLNLKRLGKLIFVTPFLLLFVNFIYFYGFWKGFLMGRQTV